MNVLSVQNAGKAFRSYRSEWRRFARWFGMNAAPTSEHWVLRDVSFAVRPGESIGIVGQNGAGKSTLLKIITGTMQPTEGSVGIDGRISAILELGMGFNLELTGRQNTVHSAGLMGLSKSEIDELLPEIEDFANIGDYFDQPVRTYSSGMQMRVAFAVATARRPDVLIVDEALAVGDAFFQHKCFERIRSFQASGTALLMVSHDRNAVQALCDRAILLEQGTVRMDGEPEAVFDFYNALIAANRETDIQVEHVDESKSRVSSGTREAEFTQIELLNCAGTPTDVLKVGEDATVRLGVQVNADIETLVLGVGIRDKFGQILFGTNTLLIDQPIRSAKAGDFYHYDVSFTANLGTGSHSIQVALVDQHSHVDKNYHWIDRALMFSVVNTSKPQFLGSQWTEMTFLCKKR